MAQETVGHAPAQAGNADGLLSAATDVLPTNYIPQVVLTRRDVEIVGQNAEEQIRALEQKGQAVPRKLKMEALGLPY